MIEVSMPGSLGRIYGILRFPASAAPCPLIILSHGFGGTHQGVDDYACFFVEHGFAAFNFDFCGGSPDSRSEGSMLDMTVLTEADDLATILSHFSADSRFTHIFLWGGSQGGFISAYTAAAYPKLVHGMVLEFPAIVLQDDARSRMDASESFPPTSKVMNHTISRKFNETAISFDLYDMLPNYSGNVLMLHGDEDNIVPLSYSQRALEAFPSASLVVLPGQKHGFIGQARTHAMQLETDFFQRESQTNPA